MSERKTQVLCGLHPVNPNATREQLLAVHVDTLGPCPRTPVEHTKMTLLFIPASARVSYVIYEPEKRFPSNGWNRQWVQWTKHGHTGFPWSRDKERFLGMSEPVVRGLQTIFEDLVQDPEKATRNIKVYATCGTMIHPARCDLGHIPVVTIIISGLKRTWKSEEFFPYFLDCFRKGYKAHEEDMRKKEQQERSAAEYSAMSNAM